MKLDSIYSTTNQYVGSWGEKSPTALPNCGPLMQQYWPAMQDMPIGALVP